MRARAEGYRAAGSAVDRVVHVSLPLGSVGFQRAITVDPTAGILACMAGFSYADAMNVELTPEQKAFAQRAEFLLTLNEAKASVARGEGREITLEAMQQLAAEAKERGRARLLTELNASR